MGEGEGEVGAAVGVVWATMERWTKLDIVEKDSSLDTTSWRCGCGWVACWVGVDPGVDGGDEREDGDRRFGVLI